jgi:glycosyltransferase involved in cell wall biosynthesis
MRITYCMMTYNRLYETMQCIARVKPYVDRVVVVDGGSNDDTIITLRNYDGVELYLHPWEDNFPQQRTNYLTHAGEDNGGTDWVLVSDPDELFSVDALKNMRKEIESAGPYNMLAFESNSVSMKGPKIVHHRQDKYWKALLFKWNKGIHYIGNPHETLVIEKGHRVKNLPYHYYHIKQDNVTWHRGARNAWVGGGGPNMGERQKLWKPFKDLVKAKTGIESWVDFDKYMIKGNIDSEIRDQLIEFRKEVGYDGSSEWREFYKTYFRIYHPEEEPEELRGMHIE